MRGEARWKIGDADAPFLSGRDGVLGETKLCVRGVHCLLRLMQGLLNCARALRATHVEGRLV